MKQFREGQRVIVRAARWPADVVGGVHRVTTIPGGAVGTVHRTLILSKGAWVELDDRVKTPHVHPFPEGARSRQVFTYPEDCEDFVDRLREHLRKLG